MELDLEALPAAQPGSLNAEPVRFSKPEIVSVPAPTVLWPVVVLLWNQNLQSLVGILSRHG